MGYSNSTNFLTDIRFKFEHVNAIYKRTVLVLFLPMLIGIFNPTSLQAQTEAIQSFSGGSTFDIFYGGSSGDVVGYRFSVSESILVTDLGVWIDGDDLQSSHQVGIWDQSQSLLVSGTVQPGDPATGDWRYTSVSQTMLSPGQTYTAGAMYASGDSDDYISSPSTITEAPEVTVINGVFPASGSLNFVYPTENSTNLARIGPNFLFIMDAPPPPPPPSDECMLACNDDIMIYLDPGECCAIVDWPLPITGDCNFDCIPLTQVLTESNPGLTPIENFDFNIPAGMEIESATLTITALGDINGTGGGLEQWQIFGETGGIVGTVGGSGFPQCSASGSSGPISLNVADISAWAADGVVSFVADATPAVNTTLCGDDFVSLELTVCFVNQPLEQTDGPPPGTEFCLDPDPDGSGSLAVTVIPISYEFDAGPNVGTQTCEFNVILNEFPDPVNSIACNDLVQVSLDTECSALITPDMILEGGPYGCYDDFDVTVVGDEGQEVGGDDDIVTAIGSYSVTVEDEFGNYCWGSIIVEDKLGPAISCAPITLKCTDLIPSVDQLLTGELTNEVFDCQQNCQADTDDFVADVPVLSTISISNPGIVTDVNVYINMEMPDFDDMYILLIGPDGTEVDVISDQCPSDDGLDVTFDDEATMTINCSGNGNLDQGLTLQPEGSLSAFDGMPVSGTWTLSVTNDFANDPTELLGWSLIVSTIPAVQVSDNCDSYPNGGLDIQYYDETLQYSELCENTIIQRTWTVTDASGLSESCTQLITITPLTMADVLLPPDVITLPCGTDTSPAGIAAFKDALNGDSQGPVGINPYSCVRDMRDPAFTPNDDGYAYAYPYVIGGCGEFVPLSPSVCNLKATYSDQVIPDCGGGYKVIRNWQVLDWCAPNDGIATHTQIIKTIDDQGPYIDISVLDHDITVATDPWGCEKVVQLPVPEHIQDDCGDYVTYWVEIAGITNDPFNLPFSETKTLGNPHYFPADMIDGDEESGYVIVSAPKGEHLVTYYAEDSCGNVGSDQITLYVVDETPPVAIAKENIVVSLTSSGTEDDGFGKLYINAVDNGSHDGCSDELYMEIRRDLVNDCWNNTFSSRATFFPYDPQDPDEGQYVKFCCDDIDPDLGYGLVDVVLRVWDDGDCDGTPGEIGEDNYNETWATVRVENKLAPTIQCPPDVTIDCDEDYLDMTLTGSATAFTTCGAMSPDFSDNVQLNSCGIGTVTRTWSVLSGGQVASCIQTIVVIAVEPFGPQDISWPSPSLTFECTPSDMGEPSWNNVPCSLVASSLEQEIFEFEDGACQKIINTWTVIDWCQYPQVQFEPYVQIVKVEDNTKPVIEECDPGTLWATTDCLAQDVEFTNTATDSGDCPSDWLKWEICLDINYDWSCDFIWTSNDGTGPGEASFSPFDHIFYVSPTGVDGATGEYSSVTVPTSASGQPELDLPIGDHRIVWTVHDGCGNVSTCEQIWTVEDKKAPTPYCIQNLSTAVMDHGGTVTIWASDFNLASEDNCTDQDDLLYSFSGEEYVPSMTFTCADLTDNGVSQVFDLEMWVWDEYANRDYCFVQLRVDDNQGVCGGGDGTADIHGYLRTETGELVDQVDVQLNSTLPEFPIEQTVDGEYAFNSNPMHHSYEISAVKDDNYLNGVSTLDLVLIQKHILGLDLLDSPYKVIAADASNDENVSAIDLLLLRQLILGITAELPNNDSWRFVDASQTFADVNNPWPFIEILNIEQLLAPMMEENFVAAKIGDVSGDATANLTSGSAEIRTSASLDLMTEDRSYVAGDVVRVDISSEDFNDIYGYQFTMNYRGLEFVNVEAGALNVTADNFGLHRTNEGMISTSWASSEAVSTSEVLFSIIFTATTNGQLSESISVGSVITPAEAYRGQSLSVENVSINFRTDNGSLSGVEYKLYQNEPNPFASATVIGFELPTASEATINIFDVTGKVIKVVKGDFAKGYNELTIERNELNSAGVMYYQLESGEYTATKKMILID